MKTIFKTIALCLVLIPFSMTVAADDDKDKSEHAEHAMHMGGMMGKMTPERLQTMQAHMLAMHDLSNKILAEKDPKKQQVLKDQQIELMKAHMADRMAKHQEHMKHKEDKDSKK
jgi:hypothetical protein